MLQTSSQRIWWHHAEPSCSLSISSFFHSLSGAGITGDTWIQTVTSMTWSINTTPMPLESSKVSSPQSSSQWEAHNAQSLEQADATAYWLSASGMLSDVDALLFFSPLNAFTTRYQLEHWFPRKYNLNRMRRSMINVNSIRWDTWFFYDSWFTQMFFPPPHIAAPATLPSDLHAPLLHTVHPQSTSCRFHISFFLDHPFMKSI